MELARVTEPAKLVLEPPGGSCSLSEAPRALRKLQEAKRGSGPVQIRPEITDLVTKLHFDHRNELKNCMHRAAGFLKLLGVFLGPPGALGPYWALCGLR